MCHFSQICVSHEYSQLQDLLHKTIVWISEVGVSLCYLKHYMLSWPLFHFCHFQMHQVSLPLLKFEIWNWVSVRFTAKTGGTLGMDKSQRIEFSLWKWAPTNKNPLKSINVELFWDLSLNSVILNWCILAPCLLYWRRWVSVSTEVTLVSDDTNGKCYLVIKVKIDKEVKRSDGLWPFTCGDIF